MSTWVGFVYTALIVDVFARMVVGWRVSASLQTELALDALEQALHARQDARGVIHYSDRGSQYVSIRYTGRLGVARIAGSVGSIEDSFDNALARVRSRLRSSTSGSSPLPRGTHRANSSPP